MKNEKKETAVEWYAIEMANYLKDFYGDGIINIDILKQAKEIEKERELNAYANGQADTLLMFKQKVSRIKDIPTEFNQIISENFWDLT
jgi:hypothetical protein